MPKNMRGIMKEFQQGKLHSGSKTGPKVKNRKQAIAIGLNQSRKSSAPSPSLPTSTDALAGLKRAVMP